MIDKWSLHSKYRFRDSPELKLSRIRKVDVAMFKDDGNTLSIISINLVLCIGGNESSEEHSIEIKATVYLENLHYVHDSCGHGQ